jgi:hypothetical protein
LRHSVNYAAARLQRQTYERRPDVIAAPTDAALGVMLTEVGRQCDRAYDG